MGRIVSKPLQFEAKALFSAFRASSVQRNCTTPTKHWYDAAKENGDVSGVCKLCGGRGLAATAATITNGNCRWSAHAGGVAS
jgi:hypothetical protein